MHEIHSEKKEDQFEGNDWILDTDINLVGLVADKLKERLTKAGWAEEEAMNMEVGFREALINAIVHGNLGLKEKPDGIDWGMAALRKQEREKSDKKVYIKLNISPEEVIIVVRDEGEGFNWQEKKEYDPLKSSGRGEIFMKAYYDSFERNEKGNEITLIKNREK